MAFHRVILAEYVFDSPQDEGEAARADGKLGDCLEVRDARRVRTYWSADRSRRISVFEAVDAETVRHAHRSAGVPFRAIWPADES